MLEFVKQNICDRQSVGQQKQVEFERYSDGPQLKEAHGLKI